MKKIALLALLLISGFASHSQIFWVENFGTSSTSGSVTSYTGPNGAWTQSVSSAGTYANEWYVSCQEQGYTTGVCGADCSGAAGLSSTLHVGATLGGDMGASYFSGLTSAFDATTDKRAESPTINCTGRTGITLSFYYIENGDGTNDDGTVYYYDGSTWTLLANPAKTSVCSSGQGQWAHASYSLPASANNNANVKIGFRWVNNTDGAGTDPSYAIDSVSLSTAGSSSGAPVPSFTVSDSTICQDSCIIATSTTAGTVDSILWVAPGISGAAAHSTTINPCFHSAGSYFIRLIAWHGGASDSTTHSITVSAAPHPIVTGSGHTLTVSGSYSSYQWYNGATAITGATNNNYTYTTAGSYYVVVDSAGCKGSSVAITGYLAVKELAGTANSYLVAQAGNNLYLHAEQPVAAPLSVTVYDATGRTLNSTNWQPGSQNLELDATNLQTGLYLIKLGNQQTNAVLKIFRQ